MVDFGLDIADPSTYWPTAKKVVGYAFGTGTPAEQMIAATVIGFGAILSSAVSLGTTLIIVPLAIFWFFVGVFRLIPGVNARWPL